MSFVAFIPPLKWGWMSTHILVHKIDEFMCHSVASSRTRRDRDNQRARIIFWSIVILTFNALNLTNRPPSSVRKGLLKAHLFGHKCICVCSCTFVQIHLWIYKCTCILICCSVCVYEFCLCSRRFMSLYVWELSLSLYFIHPKEFV